MIEQIGLILLAVLVYISVVFVIAWSKKRLDIVDIAWGGAFIVAAVTSLFLGSAGSLQILVTTLVIIWGSRLSFYILKRVLASKTEDPRYTELRKGWKGSPAVNAYFKIFVVQGILACIVSAGVISINLSLMSDITILAFVGAVIWLVGFMFESVGDAQLRRHLANPENKGKLMTAGLWKYTRHPNYFGEAVQWWGIFTIALTIPYGWLTVMSPLTITFLLLFVSGIPPTERRFEGRPGWGEYKKRTSVFLPLPPKKV